MIRTILSVFGYVPLWELHNERTRRLHLLESYGEVQKEKRDLLCEIRSHVARINELERELALCPDRDPVTGRMRKRFSA